jgi:hypothetical protein
MPPPRTENELLAEHLRQRVSYGPVIEKEIGGYDNGPESDKGCSRLVDFGMTGECGFDTRMRNIGVFVAHGR